MGAAGGARLKETERMNFFMRSVFFLF